MGEGRREKRERAGRIEGVIRLPCWARGESACMCLSWWRTGLAEQRRDSLLKPISFRQSGPAS